ncbi:hypothetical protein [Actinomadura monticuli]|uniref:Uncharacterized protein n=1 Tax=Actinomadura monticuli TaxID=3097367 RepID=A0ABV4QFK7_9ACTN
MDEIEQTKTRLREAFPGWNIIRSERGRPRATDGPLPREDLDSEASAEADTPEQRSGRCYVPADPLSAKTTRSHRRVLRWRTRLGRATAIRNLDLLAAALAPEGYRYVKLYKAGEFPARPPTLWVFAYSLDDHVRVAVGVRATPGGNWAYYEAGSGGHLSPCGNTEHAADLVNALLKHRMFPATW